MPHVIIEHSANVAEHHDIDALVDAVHRATLDLDVAPVAGVRVRAASRQHYRVADGTDPTEAFVAMTVRLGPGRDHDTKRRIIDVLLDAAEARIATEDSPLAIAWSLEVQEIDASLRVNRNRVADRRAEVG